MDYLDLTENEFLSWYDNRIKIQLTENVAILIIKIAKTFKVCVKLNESDEIEEFNNYHEAISRFSELRKFYIDMYSLNSSVVLIDKEL